MKKVIQIGGNLRINGISSFIMTLYRNIHNEYQFVFINTAEGKEYYRDEILSLGGKVYDVVVKGKDFIRAIRQAKAIRKIIKNEKPCAVHSHYYSNNGLYLRQAYFENVPVRISHCHQSNPNNLSLGKKIAKLLSSKMINKYATHKLACSETARKFLYGNDGEVCYNSVSYDRFTSNDGDVYARFNLDSSKKYYLFVGRFAPQKNTNFLLKVFNGLKEKTDIILLMVGYGPNENIIKDYITNNCLNNVVLLPSNSDVPALLSIANAFLLPSLYEGLPITLIEAQASGTQCYVSENVTQEVQLGLITYLNLDVNAWKKIIIQNADSVKEKQAKTVDRFNDKNQAALFKGFYDGIKADEWIVWGKEYSIGSKTKYRSKYLSEICFYQAHFLKNIRGSFYYALGYFEGNGVDKDTNKANSIVKNIVDEIDLKAQSQTEYTVILADMYSFGLGKELNYEKAFKLYLISAEKGNLEAMCNLGYMYQVGQGVNLDLKKSAYWYKKSADLGYVHSMRDIGQCYLHGFGVVKNDVEAARYFQTASENNYSHGTSDLAYCFLNGIGVPKDYNKAAELYKAALIQDDERTMRDLFASGIEVNALRNEGRIVLSTDTQITSVNENNTYAGTLCVAGRISYVAPECLYSSNVKKIFVEKDNAYYCATGGVLFSKDKKTLIRFAPKSTDTQYLVPSCVKKIAKHAFQNCRNLFSVLLPVELSEIDDSAFDDCKNLEQIIIPDSVTTIGAWAFHGCDKLKHIKLSANVEHIGTYAFGSCEALESIEVDENNLCFSALNGNLYNKDKTTFIQYAIAKQDDSFIMPNSVDNIAFRAFSDAYYLRDVNLSNVSTIKDKAFYYATSLSKVVMKSDVSIGDKVFDNVSADISIEVKE